MSVKAAHELIYYELLSLRIRSKNDVTLIMFNTHNRGIIHILASGFIGQESRFVFANWKSDIVTSYVTLKEKVIATVCRIQSQPCTNIHTNSLNSIWEIFFSNFTTTSPTRDAIDYPLTPQQGWNQSAPPPFQSVNKNCPQARYTTETKWSIKTRLEVQTV